MKKKINFFLKSCGIDITISWKKTTNENNFGSSRKEGISVITET